MNRKILIGLALLILIPGFFDCPDADFRNPLSSWKSGLGGETSGYDRNSLIAANQHIAQNKPPKDKTDPQEPRPTAKKPERKESLPWTELMQAAADGNDAGVVRLLKEGAKLNEKSANGWTPLMWAAEAGHVATVKILLEHGADVNAVGANGRSALMLAAYREQHEVVSTLLDNGASPNTADEKGRTALTYVCLAGDEKTATVLVTKGADVNARDEEGFTPLMKVRNSGMVDLLVKHGADVNAKSNDGMTALMTAARNKYTSVIKALLKHGADTRGKSSNGKTARDWGYWIDQGGGFMEVHEVLEIFSRDTRECALCQACIIGRIDLVGKLLQRGVDPNGHCDFEFGKTTPLVSAAGQGHARIVKLLLDKGAIISQTEANDDALFKAAETGHTEVVKLLLERGALGKTTLPDNVWADICQRCNPEFIKLLIRYGASPHDRCLATAAGLGCAQMVEFLVDNGVRVRPGAIHCAAAEGRSSVLRLLLERAKEQGVSPRGLSRALSTPSYRPDIIALLIDYGADPNERDTSVFNRTPLMTAARYGSVEAVRVLIEKGADLNLKDSGSNNGSSALTYALAGRNAEIARLLKAHGLRNESETKTLQDAAIDGDLMEAEKLLLLGADIDSQDDWDLTAGETSLFRGRSKGWSPLMWACSAGKVEMAEFLLRRKANPNLRDLDGYTALHIAAKKASSLIVKLLIDHGANVQAVTENNELTPLLVAAEAGNIEAAQVLLQYGANVKAYEVPRGDSIDEPTALDIASGKKNDKMRQLLLRFGAEYSELSEERENRERSQE
jgi:ankyrin repeat protein